MSLSETEAATVEEVVTEQGAEAFNNWSRVDPTRTDETVAQWEADDGTVVVYVERDDVSDETEYTARAQPIDDDVPFGNKIIERFAPTLETALDEAIEWMHRHRPGVPLPTFSMRIGGGVFKPLMDVLRRFGGGDTLIEVRTDGILFESASHVNAVDFRIAREDMDDLDVDQEGEFSVDTDFLWDSLKDVNFSDTVPVAHDAEREPPKLQVADGSAFTKLGTDYFQRDVPDPFPFDAKFTVPGLEFRDKINAARVLDAEDAVFGARDGIVFLRAQSPDSQAEVTARIDASDVEGEQVVLVSHDRLQELRRTIPRPSQTPVTFTLKGNDPMLVEFCVDGTAVDVTIALMTGPVPRQVEIPPEEIQVPEEAEAEAGEEAAMEEALEQAVEDTQEAEADEEPPEADAEPRAVPPPGEEEPPAEETSSIIVSIIGGTLNYNLPGRIPGAVKDEAIGAARDTLGPPWQFDANETVGEVTFRGPEIESIDLSPGRRLIGETSEGDTEPQEESEGSDGEDLLELPVHVEDDFHDGFLYAPPSNTVRLSVSREIDASMTDGLGNAEQFDAGEEVGVAFVTDEPDPQDRELVRVRGDVEPDAEQPQPEPEPEPEPASRAGNELSRAQAETIIEQATRGVTVDLQKMADEFREFRLDVVEGEGVRFRQDPDRITVSTGDTTQQTIQNAIERWGDFALIGSLEPADIADINQRREALSEQFDIDIPPLPQPTTDGLDDEDVERIVQQSTQGVDVDVRINADADSLRIRMAPADASQAAFAATLDEVQGQATNPAGAIRDALNAWEEAVDLATVEVDRVNRRRGRIGREFDLTLPEVVEPVDTQAEPRARTDLLDEWNAIMEDLDTVPVEEERLVGQSDSPIPIEVDEEFAEFADQEEKKQIEQGIQVHHTEEVHDDVHAFVAQLLGAEPENFYDSSRPSELPGYDLVYTFTLTRSRAPGEWTNPRFAPSTLFELLGPLDGDRIRVVSRGAPLA